MKTLVFTATAENLQIARSSHTMGFSGRVSPTGDSRFGDDQWANEPGVGDRAVIYAIGVGIVGVVEVTSSLYRSVDPLWEDELYPWRVTFRIVQWFDQPLSAPEGLRESAVFRANPRLLTVDEATTMAHGIGEALLALE
jgi:hypothetical protein